MEKILNSLPTQDNQDWRQVIYENFKDQPYPMFIFENTIIPAASVWNGIRVWIRFFRSLNLKMGTRILLALPPCPAFLFVFFASFWENLTIVVLTTPNIDHKKEMETYIKTSFWDTDSHLLISRHSFPFPYNICIDESGLPSEKYEKTIITKEGINPKHEEIRLLLKTSGSTSLGNWVALSNVNIASVLFSHIKEIRAYRERTLSILPWGHVFGLIIDLLCAIFSKCEIVRDKSEGKNIESIIDNMVTFSTTYLCLVPKTLNELLKNEIGQQLLVNLKGGIIGAAPISKKLANFLLKTNLRVGYGQTEASPGILLGKPGVWSESYIGNPLGCEVQINSESELEFKGKNLAIGYWSKAGLERFPQKDWKKTGDLVEKIPIGYKYIGRKDDRVKLPNGYFLDLEFMEKKFLDKFPMIQNIMFYIDSENLFYVFYSSKRDFLDKEFVRRFIKYTPDTIENVPHSLFHYNKKGTLNRKMTFETILNFQKTG